MGKQIIVTAAIIEKEGKFLLTQRLESQPNPLFWEFVGGKVEFGEDPRDCMKREVEEEIGIDVEVSKIIDVSSTINREGLHVILLGFRCKYLSGEIEKIKINDYRWLSPIEMTNYKMAETDKQFVETLKNLEIK